MPQVNIYLSEQDYAFLLDEASKRKTTSPKLLASMISEMRTVRDIRLKAKGGGLPEIPYFQSWPKVVAFVDAAARLGIGGGGGGSGDGGGGGGGGLAVPYSYSGFLDAAVNHFIDSFQQDFDFERYVVDEKYREFRDMFFPQTGNPYYVPEPEGGKGGGR
ncbi:MAG: hypothetical protein QW334_04285 [Thermofilum sp.]